jgi:hypothetical protein
VVIDLLLPEASFPVCKEATPSKVTSEPSSSETFSEMPSAAALACFFSSLRSCFASSAYDEYESLVMNDKVQRTCRRSSAISASI